MESLKTVADGSLTRTVFSCKYSGADKQISRLSQLILNTWSQRDSQSPDGYCPADAAFLLPDQQATARADSVRRIRQTPASSALRGIPLCRSSPPALFPRDLTRERSHLFSGKPKFDTAQSLQLPAGTRGPDAAIIPRPVTTSSGKGPASHSGRHSRSQPCEWSAECRKSGSEAAADPTRTTSRQAMQNCIQQDGHLPHCPARDALYSTGCR